MRGTARWGWWCPAGSRLVGAEGSSLPARPFRLPVVASETPGRVLLPGGSPPLWAARTGTPLATCTPYHPGSVPWHQDSTDARRAQPVKLVIPSARFCNATTCINWQCAEGTAPATTRRGEPCAPSEFSRSWEESWPSLPCQGLVQHNKLVRCSRRLRLRPCLATIQPRRSWGLATCAIGPPRAGRASSR